MTIKIFVSHAAKDVELVEAFVHWLERCVEAPDGTIRCTTLAGYGLPVGGDEEKILRENLEACSLVIALVTDAALSSSYVLAELGAGWALQKVVACLLLPGIGFNRLPGPIASRHAMLLDDQARLAGFAAQLSEVTGLKSRNPAQVTGAGTAFAAAVAKAAAKAAHDRDASTVAAIAAAPSTSHALIDDEGDALLLLQEWLRWHNGPFRFSEVDAELKVVPGMTKKIVGQVAGFAVNVGKDIFTAEVAQMNPFVVSQPRR